MSGMYTTSVYLTSVYLIAVFMTAVYKIAVLLTALYIAGVSALYKKEYTRLQFPKQEYRCL